MANDNQLIEVNPSLLEHIDNADRAGWDYETYVTVAMDVIHIKQYSQWTLGKLAYEVNLKWGEGADFARKIGVDPTSLRVYKHTYARFHEIDNEYTPPLHMPWGVLQQAAQTENPVETLQHLEDTNNTTIKSAYREIKVQETGVVPPPRPRVKLKFDPDKELWCMTIPPEDIKNIDWQNLRARIVETMIDEE